MLVPYSWIKDFVDLKVSPEKIEERLSLTTIGVEGVEKKKGDYVFDLEVTYNRGDLLSIIGVARELSALFNTDFKEEKFTQPGKNLETLPIK